MARIKYYVEFRDPRTGSRRYVSAITPASGSVRHTYCTDRALLLTESEVQKMSGRMFTILTSLKIMGVSLKTIEIRMTKHDPDHCSLYAFWEPFIGWK